MDDNNQNKAIYALLQNGSTTYIDLSSLNKNIGRIYPLNKKFYFLLYDNDDKQAIGIIIDWNKQIVKDNILVANETIVNSNISVIPNIRLSSFLVYNQENKVINWISFNLPQDNSNIDTIINGSFVLSDNSSLRSVFPIIDGSYGFITAEVLYDKKNILNVSEPNLFIYYKFLIPVTRQISEKFLIHYARNTSEMFYISCSPSYSEFGNVCMMTDLVESFQNYSLFLTYQIDFLSSGSVIKLQSPYIQKVYTGLNSYNRSQFDIKPLFYDQGGLVAPPPPPPPGSQPAPVNSNDQVGNITLSNMTANIISLNGSEMKWDLDNIRTTKNTGLYVMKKNTYILFAIYDHNIWDIFSTDLPKFNQDYGYENPNIISTYPTIESCNILNDTLNCTISSSIFNQWDSSYMIIMDNNFVKFASTKEPIVGVDENKWIFKTIPRQEQGMYSDSAICIIRLTSDGTRKYNSLSTTEKLEFFNNFQQELIESIPTRPERFQLTNQIQYDPSASSKYLIQIKILSTKDLYQDSVSQIIKDLTELIKNKDTIIYMNNHTKYLDSSYGLVINSNLWNEIKWKLLVLLIGLIVLIALALWARYKNPQGQNFMIVKSVFILFDLTMDILFVVKNGKDVPWLYIPSITILIVSLVFNMVIATMLITHELRENCSFIKWFNEYKSVISIFTICSGADISLFEFLMSRFAGFEIFNAPFSNFTINWIYLGTVINTLIEEIPQLIVQVNT
ncbi:hypothetical protein F8M41_008018 [Gigaspora margarita]|uniref:Uncharacterized protein n=1 Tax=Gigaspora margarita TaxID=4874 RepID=A0A8H4A4X0_GIGMA|nr:hypothetical protein F8M41_008018 [Gigaspora margarita]